MIDRILNPPFTALAHAYGPHWTRRLLGHIDHIGVVSIDDGQASPGHNVEKPSEAQLDLFKRPINIRMIEFNIIDHCELRKVMKKL